MADSRLAWRLQALMVWMILPLAVIAAGAPDLPPWLFSEAHTRLVTTPVLPRSHTLRIDIPLHLRERSLGARAVDRGGNPLSLFPILDEAERLTAVEVRITITPDADEERPPPRVPFSLLVYLFDAPIAVPESYRRLPVSLSLGPGIGIARPGGCSGFLTLYSKIRPLKYRGEITSLSSDAMLDRLPSFVPKKHKLVYHLSTLWQCDTARELQFAVLNQDNGAWYMFIDQEPVFSWMEATRDKRQRLVSPSRLVAPGLHRVDFFGMLLEEELAPALAYREVSADAQFQRFGNEELQTITGIDELLIEGKGDLIVPGFRLRQGPSFLFPASNRVLQRVVVHDLSSNLFGHSLIQQEMEIDGRQLFFDGAPRLTTYLPVRPRHELLLTQGDILGYHQEVTTPVRLRWQEPTRVQVDFQAVGLPYLQPEDGPAMLDYYLRVSPAFEEAMLSDAQLVVRRRTAEGRVLETQRAPIPASPFLRHVAIDASDPAIAETEISIELAELAIADPIRVYHLTPASVPNFRTSAGLLRYGDGLALLRREARLAGATAPDIAIGDLLLVDDFMTSAGHVRDTLLPSQWGLAAEKLSIRMISLHSNPLIAVDPTWAKFVYLQRALKTPGDAIIWAVGKSDLERGISVPDYRAQLIFLVEATLKAGKIPILITLPIVHDLTQSRLRLYALAVMELAAEYDLPVVDLYSASLRRQNIDLFYRIDERADLLSSTPNAQGRAWLFQHILSTVTQYNDERTSH